MIRANFYGKAYKSLFNGDGFNWETDPMYVALLTPSYSPSLNNHGYWNDVSANEISGTGYVPGGQRMVGNTLVFDPVAQAAELNATTLTWGPPATFDSAYAVCYRNTGDKPLLGLINFGGTSSVNSGTFSIQWGGLFGEVVIS